MEAMDLSVSGPRVITPRVFGDERGFFVESYQQERYGELLGSPQFVQDNLSTSQKGVLRGLHYQHAPHGQGKLVSVIKGSVFDVAVDIRPDSDTFGEHVSIELSAPKRSTDGTWHWQQFWIPTGFAHGFVALEDDTIFAYKCSDSFYSPEHDAGLLYNDADIAIKWPDLGMDYIVSEKDQKHPTLAEHRKNLGL